MNNVFGARDLRVFFGMGVPVSFNGVSLYPNGQPIRGLVDSPMQNRLADEGFGGVDIAMPEVRLPFNAFNPMPTNDDEIFVDGTLYLISDTTTEDDGAIVCFAVKST